MAEIEDGFLVVTLDRKNLFEDGLEAVVLPFSERDILLEEVDVGIELHLDQVWRLNRFFDATEVNAFCPF